ncbi:erythromycin esterase family protein [Emticicia sp. BO119]|uniref:erythromycin esterase family protein n=1 Tax=Emticicia sp. BO119 TaxID=2757768 RepID=UPI0015F0E290|nr:erythromycin esterase family protein [Emticicia sp. BO119]MBA4849186.1 erythromycin esterase family protein [Emticicia sp. BO119]
MPEKSFVTLSDSILIKGDSDNELSVLYEQARNKKIVAIGEVTHGTREVLAFQKLIAVNLVKRHDFNCIVLGEVSLLDAYKINDFVVNQRGTTNDLMIEGKPKVREMAYRQLDMLEFYSWIRDFNKNRPFNDKVWVIGTDIDDPREIVAFVKAHCQFYYLRESKAILEKLIYDLKKIGQSNKITIKTIEEDANQVIKVIEKSRNGVDSVNLKIDLMIHVLKSLPQLVVFSSDADLKYKIRDKFIFENINWLIDSCKKDKMVIIKAHNFHINKRTIYTEVFGKFLSFGEYLSRRYQKTYLSIGTEVQQGRFYTGATTFSKIAEHKHKIGTVIGSDTKALYGILFHDSLAKEFLNKPLYTISYGTVNYKSSLLINSKGMLGDAFDALIFIRNSSPYRSEKD